MKKPIDYQAKKLELDAILAWFESSDVQIDQALKRYNQAEVLIKELETYLKDTKTQIDRLVNKKASSKS